MNLDEATNEFNRVNKSFADLMYRREQLKKLVLQLQNNERNDSEVLRIDGDSLPSYGPGSRHEKSKVKMSGSVSNEMSLEAARTSLSSVRDSIAKLLKRQTELYSLIESLKTNKGTANITKNNDSHDELSPREQFKKDTKDMWREDYSEVSSVVDTSVMSPRDKLSYEMKNMCK